MTTVGTPDPAPNPGWLNDNELETARQRLPLLYVEAVPVRVDGLGRVVEVGMLLRANDGDITRTLVSGRVMYGETLRDALFRHLEKDLGPMAFPLLPTSPVPFSVAEYFPWPSEDTQYMDARQHAVSLAYVVPVTGTCEPRQDALEISWMRPAEAASETITSDMEGGRGALLRAALASVGVLP